MSVFPPIPSDVEVNICTVDGTDLICFAPVEIQKIAIWSEQVLRWRDQVKRCSSVKETVASNTEAFNQMARRGHHQARDL